MKTAIAVLALITLTGCATNPCARDRTSPAASTIANPVIESSEPVDPADYNARLSTAAAAGEDWPRSPLAATIELLHGDLDTHELELHELKNRVEGADVTVIELIRDGFQDDSVRGDWHRIEYARQADGTWRINAMQRATRCWRGHRLVSYGTEPCR